MAAVYLGPLLTITHHRIRFVYSGILEPVLQQKISGGLMGAICNAAAGGSGLKQLSVLLFQ